MTLGAAKEELDHLLGEAVREHLLSDVPLGVWLSGGIDSSTILHYAAQASSSQLKTLSISFRGRTFDETPYIRDVVNQYGTDHEQFDLNPTENLTGAIEEFAYYSDEPTADAGALPIWFLSKLSKTKVTVTLSGEGGDEVFGGYLTYRANELARIARHVPPGLLRFALGALRAWPVSDDKISLEYKLKRFLEGCLMPCRAGARLLERHFFRGAKRAPSCKHRFRPRSTASWGACAKSCRATAFVPYMWFDQKYYLTDDILMKVDRMSMAHAVEARPPLLDHRIVEFAASLPGSFKVNGSRQKVLLKELMKDKLPAIGSDEREGRARYTVA